MRIKFYFTLYSKSRCMLNSAFVRSATGRDAAEQHVKAGPLTPKGRDRQLLHKARDLYILCTTPHV